MARAAAHAAGAVFTLSTIAHTSVRRAGGGRAGRDAVVPALRVPRPRGQSRARRWPRSRDGFEALVVTVDLPGRRRLGTGTCAAASSRPTRPPYRVPRRPRRPARMSPADFAGLVDPSLTWDDIEAFAGRVGAAGARQGRALAGGRPARRRRGRGRRGRLQPRRPAARHRALRRRRAAGRRRRRRRRRSTCSSTAASAAAPTSSRRWRTAPAPSWSAGRSCGGSPPPARPARERCWTSCWPSSTSRSRWSAYRGRSTSTARSSSPPPGPAAALPG